MSAMPNAKHSSLLFLFMTGVLINCEPEVCGPAGNKTVWVFCSHHKTGSVLVDNVLREIHQDLGIMRQKFLDNELRPYLGQNSSFVDISARVNSKLLVWKHVDFINPDSLLADGEDGTTAKLVIFLRDPIEVILSGYFYHMRTEEAWANLPYTGTEPFQKLCAAGHRGDIATMASCTALQMLPPMNNFTLRQLLNAVDMPVGVFIEAVRALSELEALRRTYSQFSSDETCHRAIVCFLDDVVADMESAFRDIFTFLGADYVDHCINLALRHDLKALEQQQAKSGQMKHAMDASLRPVRDALRLILKSTPWFQATVDPIRKGLQYPPISLTSGEATQRQCRSLC